MDNMFKRLLKNKTNINFWFDLFLLILFVLTGITAYTDKQLHQTLGLLMSGTVVLHLWLHWQWVTAMISRFRTVKPAMRLKVGLDTALLITYLLLFLSGLIVMLIWAPAVRDFHTWMFYSFIGLTGGHLMLNWKWLHSQIKRRLPSRPRRVAQNTALPS